MRYSGVRFSLRTTVWSALCLLLALGGCDCGRRGRARGPSGHLRVATSGDTATAKAIVEALGTAGIKADLVETRSSIASLAKLSEGSIDFAVVPGDVAWYAVNGTGIYDTPLKGVSAVMPLEPWRVLVLAPQGGPSGSVDAVRGKRVVVGPPGSTLELTSRHVLSACGLSFDDLGRAISLTVLEGDSSLRAKEADALIYAGSPASAVYRRLQEGPFVSLGFSAAAAQALRDKHPFYERAVPQTQPGQPAQPTAVGLTVLLVASSEVAAKDVERVAQAVLSGVPMPQRDLWQRGLSPIPLHAGARTSYDAKAATPSAVGPTE
ncbi:MAG: TAXI family TRAP transporter solute-binding subunit [Verrucomicrobia bacterium]|nr:TAXI family TRAP transporter solute-binding subunit [Verrucomicrobiota bacterium]